MEPIYTLLCDSCQRWMALLTESDPRPGDSALYPASYGCYMCGGQTPAPDQPTALTDGVERWEKLNGQPVPD